MLNSHCLNGTMKCTEAAAVPAGKSLGYSKVWLTFLLSQVLQAPRRSTEC